MTTIRLQLLALLVASRAMRPIQSISGRCFVRADVSDLARCILAILLTVLSLSCIFGT